MNTAEYFLFMPS